VTGHVGIMGNEMADQLAKRALTKGNFAKQTCDMGENKSKVARKVG